MNSTADLSTNSATISHQIQSAAFSSDRPRTAIWIALALFGLGMIGCGVAGSYYTNIIVAPYVGP
jgi:threonine/homoserine efflux transporter RhtA